MPACCRSFVSGRVRTRRVTVRPATGLHSSWNNRIIRVERPKERGMPIKMKKIKSSNIQSAGYDGKKHVMVINFGGPDYHYADVPVEVYTSFCSADSKGKFFHTEIRDKFEHEKQED